jgi:hypothetical protein
MTGIYCIKATQVA